MKPFKKKIGLFFFYLGQPLTEVLWERHQLLLSIKPLLSRMKRKKSSCVFGFLFKWIELTLVCLWPNYYFSSNITFQLSTKLLINKASQSAISNDPVSINPTVYSI